MNTDLKNFSISMMLLLAAVVLPASVFAQQAQDRIIKKHSWNNEPIKITKVKVEGVSIEFGEKIQAKDDWLRGLTVSVTNTSDKAVCFINIALDFPRTKSQEPQTRECLIWGCTKDLPNAVESSKKIEPFKPGESIDIVLTDELYKGTQEFLRQTNYPESIDLVEIVVDEVGFEGEKDTLWISGQMMRRDPSNSRRWLPIHSENQ